MAEDQCTGLSEAVDSNMTNNTLLVASLLAGGGVALLSGEVSNSGGFV